MKRSARALLLAMTLVASGCARHAPAPHTIAFVGWGAPEERAVLEGALADFERAHPGVRVVYTQVPGVGYDYLNKLRLMIVAGLSPDVFYVPDGAFAELARSGALLDLDARVARDVDVDAMWSSSVDRYRWNGRRTREGHLFALPKDIGPTAMFYDKDRFRARGVAFPDPVVPMTWTEARAMWRALGSEEDGVHRWGTTGFPFETAIWSSGGDVLVPDRRAWGMATPEAERAVQWCADLALEDGVAPLPSRAPGGGGRELFEARLAATHIDGRWMVPRFRKLGFDWDVAPVPVPDGARSGIVWSGSVGLAVSSKGRDPDDAFALVAWLAGPEGQARLARTGLQVPNQRALAMTDVFLQPGLRPAHADVFVRAAEGSRPSAVTETPDAYWFDVMAIHMEQVWRGERTAASLFPEIAPRIDRLLRARGAD
jgi:multiple sugar transport system substrate-binding protein